jgi:DNA modification methylase
LVTSKFFQEEYPATSKNRQNLLSASLESLVAHINDFSYDKEYIPQERLDLINKSRTSLFPWRGQFSPELIEVFLSNYASANSVILDPFVGSGTTIFEAQRKGLKCYGEEINPSAIEMTKTVQFGRLSAEERKVVIRRATSIVENHFRPFSRDLFSLQEQDISRDFDTAQEEVLKAFIQETKSDPSVHNFLVNALIRYMSYRSPHVQADFFRAMREHGKIVENLPLSQEEAGVLHCDARSIPLSAHGIDLIITSPPYINVFNYHQNNRPAMELLDWDLLEIAKSEIGSNRKHRQNRFLTVIQYALDMLDVLFEMKRLLKPDGRAIIVVGRESNVRGVSFKNGLLVALLALGTAGFQLSLLQERKFTNKFGEIIYEDILHLTPDKTVEFINYDIARSVAIWALEQAYILADEQVRAEILEAKTKVFTVQKSPLFRVSTAE